MFKKELLKNKIMGGILLFIGAASVPLTDDLTAAALMGLFGLPVFFAKENVVD